MSLLARNIYVNAPRHYIKGFMRATGGRDVAFVKDPNNAILGTLRVGGQVGFNGRAFITTSTKKADPVSAMSFSKGHRTEKEIGAQVHEDGPIKPEVDDVKRVAFPLKADVINKLTPTMLKYTNAGKVAVVTGGARGLGYNMSQGLAESGVRGIAILDIQRDIGEQAAKEIEEQTGVQAIYFGMDVRKDQEVAQAIKGVHDHFGHIDILINAAGIADSNMKAETYDLHKFRNLMDINVTGTFTIAQAVAKYMIADGNGGSIINIASMSGSIVNFPQEQSCYNASKAAVAQLTKSLAAEWAPLNIRVNSISPGYMDTALNRAPTLESQKKIWVSMTPQKRLGTVDDLNNLAVFLASDGSGFMTGANCIIDGGYTLW